MPTETEQQYTAWLLYCEAGSLQKTLNLWDKIGQVWVKWGWNLPDALIKNQATQRSKDGQKNTTGLKDGSLN